MKNITDYFRKIDPLLYSLTNVIPFPALRTSDDYFADLVEDIVSQQLSDKAARTIYGRVADNFPRKKPMPELILKSPDDVLRSAGLSRSKTMYIKDLSRRVAAGDLNLARIAMLDDAGVIAELTKVKGIGNWTAEMFLMFSLGREDVFSAGDLGLRNAITRLYGEKSAKQPRLEKLTRRWSPYRSYACLLLWRSNDIADAEVERIRRSIRK